MTTDILGAAAWQGAHAAADSPAGASAYRFLAADERRRIGAFLDHGRPLDLLLFEIENFRALGDVYGPLVAERTAGAVAAELSSLCAEHLACCRLLYVEAVEPGQFLVLCGSEKIGRAHV